MGPIYDRIDKNGVINVMGHLFEEGGRFLVENIFGTFARNMDQSHQFYFSRGYHIAPQKGLIILSTQKHTCEKQLLSPFHWRVLSDP